MPLTPLSTVASRKVEEFCSQDEQQWSRAMCTDLLPGPEDQRGITHSLSLHNERPFEGDSRHLSLYPHAKWTQGSNPLQIKQGIEKWHRLRACFCCYSNKMTDWKGKQATQLCYMTNTLPTYYVLARIYILKYRSWKIIFWLKPMALKLNKNCNCCGCSTLCRSCSVVKGLSGCIYTYGLFYQLHLLYKCTL